MSWIVLEGSESRQIEELGIMSDRAAAIVAAVLIETRIEWMLKNKLLDHKKTNDSSIHADMFRSTGPLGAFSAKIDFAFMLGFYGAGPWKDLHYIREIRNAFAHQLDIMDFESDKIAGLTKNISWFERCVFEPGNEPRSTHDIPVLMSVRNLAPQLKNHRERYLLAVKFYVAVFYASATLHFLPEYRPPHLCTPLL